MTDLPGQGETTREPLCPLGGVLLLDKPCGVTSQFAVARVKRLLGVDKAGHTGTLDPLATGLLPVCTGEATKFAHLLLESEKTYEANIRLGITTSTGDSEGETLTVSPVTANHAAVADVLGRFIGRTTQVPPMYSALKHQGRPLYKLARQGIAIERSPRPVWIRSIDLLQFEGELLQIRVTCGKGTYLRVLAEDVGRALGCGASLAALRRVAVGAFVIEDAVTLERLESLDRASRLGLMLSMDAPVAALPRIDFDLAQVRRLLYGQVVADCHADAGPVRIYGPSGDFLGVGTCDEGGTIMPRRLVRLRPDANNA